MPPKLSRSAEQPIENDRRWKAVAERDHRFDGRFYYAVRTTGVYCRPSCSARRANRENVTFYSTVARAETAGFRPCARCKPHQLSADADRVHVVAQLCRLIESQESVPSLSELARECGLSVYHMHRIFKSVTGITPRAYAVAHRKKRVKSNLTTRGSVTEAIYGAGYNSNSRFYETADQMLGMTPKVYRAGGKSADIRYTMRNCSLGTILVAATDRGVCAVFLGDDRERLLEDLTTEFPQANVVFEKDTNAVNDTIPGKATFSSLVDRVLDEVDGVKFHPQLPLDIRGTAFQQRVWAKLRSIPPGTTSTYTELAESTGSPKSVRAVAAACAANKIAVVIPCHRVVRRDRSLAGYRWGIERKRALIAREKKGDSSKI